MGGSVLVGWTKCHENTEKGVFNIDWGVARCWEDLLRDHSRLWVLKFEEDFVEGTESKGSIPSRDPGICKGIEVRHTAKHRWDRTGKEHLLDCRKNSCEVINSQIWAGVCRRQALRWYTMINTLVETTFWVWMESLNMRAYYLVIRLCYTAQLTIKRWGLVGLAYAHEPFRSRKFSPAGSKS